MSSEPSLDEIQKYDCRSGWSDDQALSYYRQAEKDAKGNCPVDGCENPGKLEVRIVNIQADDKELRRGKHLIMLGCPGWKGCFNHNHYTDFLDGKEINCGAIVRAAIAMKATRLSKTAANRLEGYLAQGYRCHCYTASPPLNSSPAPAPPPKTSARRNAPKRKNESVINETKKRKVQRAQVKQERIASTSKTVYHLPSTPLKIDPKTGVIDLCTPSPKK